MYVFFLKKRNRIVGPILAMLTWQDTIGSPRRPTYEAHQTNGRFLKLGPCTVVIHHSRQCSAELISQAPAPPPPPTQHYIDEEVMQCPLSLPQLSGSPKKRFAQDPARNAHSPSVPALSSPSSTSHPKVTSPRPSPPSTS